jgi:hypothetical protein
MIPNTRRVLWSFTFVPGFDETIVDIRHCLHLNGFATPTTRLSEIEPSCSQQRKVEDPRECLRSHLRGDGSIPTFPILWEKVRTPLRIRCITLEQSQFYDRQSIRCRHFQSNPKHTTGDATIIIYGYTPSIVVGILGIVLFALAGVLHLWQLLKYRSWYFSTMIVGIAFVRHSHSKPSPITKNTNQ